MHPEDGQRRAAWIATISALIVVATFVAGKAARDAILLSAFDVKLLPVFIGISALLSLPIILIAGKLMARFGPAHLMPALNLLSAAFAVLEWLMISESPRPTAVAVFFHLSISGAVLVSGFWSIINERFDVQSAKRHIGRIGMGATLGGILGGLIAEGTAVYLAPDTILLVLAALQLVCAIALFLVRGTRPVRVAVKSEGTWSALRLVTRSQLLRNVGIVVVLGAIAAGVLDYVFKADIVARGQHNQLLGSLAVFYTVTSVLAAVIQIAVCGPLIARLGVPRSVSTLPVTVTLFGLAALAIPTTLAAAIARGAELITRNSIYRSGYELLYAPLPEADKRPTKVILDVGAERIGDLLGAQLVGAIVYLAVEPRQGLLIAAVMVAAIATIFATRLPRSYTMALEESLLAHGAEPAPPVGTPPRGSWVTLTGVPVLGQAGELAPLSIRMRHRSPRGVRPPIVTADVVTATLADLRSHDVERVKRALASPLTSELAAHVVGLIGRDDVGREALLALRNIAPHCTGMLVDALLDRTRDETIRRRIPEVLLAGDPALATWGLWRGLADPCFEVRYHCGSVLARLAASGHLDHITTDEVFETVRRELVADPQMWRTQRIRADLVLDTTRDGDKREDPIFHHTGGELEHVFTVLGLVLPAEPLRIALHAVQTEDSELRGTALEYLESILPPDVRMQLWPLLENDELPAQIVPPPPKPPGHHHIPRSKEEIVAALNLAYPSILEKLHKRAHPHR